MTDNQLLIFGDSISCGVMYDEAAHRYTLCRNTYDRVLRTQGVAVKSYAKPAVPPPTPCACWIRPSRCPVRPA